MTPTATPLSPEIKKFQPLKGVRVLELSQILAGPTCGLMLADLGADVVKVERFPAGDDARKYRRPGDSGLPPSFMMLNRGKRSMGLDLKSPAGIAVLKRMVAQSDVLTENFRLGVMERLGVGYDELREVNPGLIYCSITGYGRTGPMASKGGFDMVMQAFAGTMSVTGEAGRAPVKIGISVADVNAGILAAFGILAAYIERLKTGQGTRVETSLLQASMQQLYWFAAAYFHTGAIAKPAGTAHSLIAPYQVFQCADGGLALGGANQGNWERIARILGHPEWIQDPRFQTGAERLAHRETLEALINTELGRETIQTWVERFDAAGVPAGPVQNVGQALDHPQAKAVNMVIEADDPHGGKSRALGLPILFDGSNVNATTAAPALGQHTGSVLHGFGFGDVEIDALLRDGVVFEAVPAVAAQAA